MPDAVADPPDHYPMRDERPGSPLNLQTGLSLALVAVLIGAAVTYGRQSARLDSIESEVRDSRAEMKAMRSEIGSLRELLIQRTPSSAQRFP